MEGYTVQRHATTAGDSWETISPLDGIASREEAIAAAEALDNARGSLRFRVVNRRGDIIWASGE